MEQNLASSLEQPSPSKGAEQVKPANTNSLLLVAAVCLALNARNPNPRSPAHAVQHVYRETSWPDEPVLVWIQRFFNMAGGDYSIRWDWQCCDWRTDGDQRIAGLTIAEDCVYWLQRNWDFAMHEIDDRYGYGDCRTLELHAKALKELSCFNFGDFILPGRGEMVRRIWRSVPKGPVRMLDIWESPAGGKYHYAIREQGNPEILARSVAPYYAHVLCKLVDEELVPSSASKPFVVKVKARSS